MARRAASAGDSVANVAVEKLTAAQAKAEHARLEAEIRGHDERYYQHDAPTVSDAEYDALRRRYQEIEASFPELRSADSLTLKSRRGTVAAFRQGASRGADAVARQCVQRAGCRRFRRSHPALSAAQRRRTDHLQRRAEDRRAVDVAALRGRCACRPPPPAATASRARTSPRTSRHSRMCRNVSKAGTSRPCARCAARST